VLIETDLTVRKAKENLDNVFPDRTTTIFPFSSVDTDNKTYNVRMT